MYVTLSPFFPSHRLGRNQDSDKRNMRQQGGGVKTTAGDGGGRVNTAAGYGGVNQPHRRWDVKGKENSHHRDGRGDSRPFQQDRYKRKDFRN